MTNARIAVLCLLFTVTGATERPSHLPLDYRGINDGIPVVEPSDNAARRGSYQAGTGTKGYDYWVHLPRSYDPTRPVGLALFFHGQGSHGGARNVGSVGKDLLERHNLILVNMQYHDGDNAKDTPGKVDAAKEAIAQVMADYPIVAGRGLVASFSGGGLPHAMLLDQLGRKDGPGRGYHWPFCHNALFGSNFWKAASDTVPMTWHIAVGQKEWGLANLGRDNSARIAELCREAKSNPDFAMRVEAGKGHSISTSDRQANARMFARSELFLAPFIHTPSYDDRSFRKTLEAGMRLRYGQTLEALDDLLADEHLGNTQRESAENLRRIVVARADAMLAELEHLSAADPLLAAYYLGIARANHLKDHPHEERIVELFKQVTRSEAYAKATKAAGWWYQNAGGLVAGGELAPRHRETVAAITEQVPPESLIGIWAAELLALQ